MKDRNLLVLLLAVALPMAACTQLKPEDQSRSGIQLEQHLAEHDYNGARQWLDDQAGEGADTRSGERLLEQHIHSFEQSTLSQVSRLEKSGDWNEALIMLNAALEKLPHSAVLLAERKRALALRDPALQRSIESELLTRSEYLAKSLAVLENRRRIRSPTLSESVHKTRLRVEQREISSLLLSCATNAIKREDYDHAEKCLRAAKAGGDPAEARQLREKLAAAKLNGGNSAKEQRTRLARQKETITKYRQRLHAALGKGDLTTARDIIRKLMLIEGHTPEYTALRNAIQAATSARIAELHDSANAYYRDSEVALARKQWQEILDLDPQNEQARTNIERADRVLKNLETLQKENGAGSPAAAGETPANL